MQHTYSCVRQLTIFYSPFHSPPPVQIIPTDRDPMPQITCKHKSSVADSCHDEVNPVKNADRGQVSLIQHLICPPSQCMTSPATAATVAVSQAFSTCDVGSNTFSLTLSKRDLGQLDCHKKRVVEDVNHEFCTVNGSLPLKRSPVVTLKCELSQSKFKHVKIQMVPCVVIALPAKKASKRNRKVAPRKLDRGYGNLAFSNQSE